MKWFRSNIRLGSRLALLALAVQFWMSFGHFHGGSALAASVDPKRPGRHHTMALHETMTFTAAPLDAAFHGPFHSPLSDPDEDCAICAVMALADTMLDASPPSLSPPYATTCCYRAAASRFAEPDSIRVGFRPRAPPTV